MISKKKVFTKIHFFFSPTLSALQKKNSTFVVQITASPSQLLPPTPVGGAVFIFGAKIGLKSPKNVLFCILFWPIAPLPPPGYATASTRLICLGLVDQRWKKDRPRDQRWSPRGHVLKSLALASKLKFSASNPRSPRKCPVLGLRTALISDWVKRKVTKYKNFLNFWRRLSQDF